MDAVLLANELVDSRVKQNKPRILYQLDMGMAYDHVNCTYLIDILRNMSF